MSRIICTVLLSLFCLAIYARKEGLKQPTFPVEQEKLFQQKVKHIVVIFQENWSFDGLYGKFPMACNLDSAKSFKQVDFLGKPLAGAGFKNPLRPYRLDSFGVPPTMKTADLIHRFHTERLQINEGKMDKFVCWSDQPELVMSYYDASVMPEGKIAKRFTLCDHFFHSAYGGSYLNHMWLVAAKTPQWPKEVKAAPLNKFSSPLTLSTRLCDNQHPYDGALDSNIDKLGRFTANSHDYYPINTIYSENLVPYWMQKNSKQLMPSLNDTTIADRLNEKHISWAWYAGGWDKLGDTAYCRQNEFQYHHQPFSYFKRTAQSNNLKDELAFFAALHTSKGLPQVSFIKPIGKFNEHPSYASLSEGQQHVSDIIDSIEQSPYWQETLVIIAYDENGGRWDHVAPPINTLDSWGPGSRVPAIIVSPWSMGGTIDKSTYETVSILKTIEVLFQLQPLGERDKHALPMIQSLHFK